MLTVFKAQKSQNREVLATTMKLINNPNLENWIPTKPIRSKENEQLDLDCVPISSLDSKTSNEITKNHKSGKSQYLTTDGRNRSKKSDSAEYFTIGGSSSCFHPSKTRFKNKKKNKIKRDEV